MYILRRLPYAEAPSQVAVGGETIPVRAYQAIVWVSLSTEASLEADAPRFPAVLDTGHSHNFSIREDQLITWAGVDPGLCRRLGVILVNRLEVPLLGVGLWIHRNRPGTTQLLAKPTSLPIPEGISVYPTGTAYAPRLPLLGLRALARNRLRLLVDGMQVSLSTRTPKRLTS